MVSVPAAMLKMARTEVESDAMAISLTDDDDVTIVKDSIAIATTPRNKLKIEVVEDIHSSSPPSTSQFNPEKMVMTTPMSTHSIGTATTASMSTSATDITSYFSSESQKLRRSLDSGPSYSREGTPRVSHSPRHSIRVPLPSPTRSRLDRQYAKRLAATCTYNHTPTAKSPRSLSTTPSGSSNIFSRENDVIPPPGISRDSDSSKMFRPTPIISPHEENRGRRQFFFPNSPQRRSYSEASFGSANSIMSQCCSVTMSKTTSPSLASSRRPRKSNLAKSIEIGISDRFIPSRATSNMNTINLWDSMVHSHSSGSPRRHSSGSNRFRNDGGDGDDVGNHRDGTNRINTGQTPGGTSDDSNVTTGGGSVNPATGRVNETSSITTQQNLHNVLLRSELLGENVCPYSYATGSHVSSRLNNATPLSDGMNRLRFQSPRQAYHDSIYESAMGPTSVVNSFSLTPLGNASSRQLMTGPQKNRRKIAKVPFKVLDAPALQDDFYLNLVDWSSQNVLAVGLGPCVYLWSACTSKVTKLCDLQQAEDVVTSVSWAQRGTHLAVGTNKGEVQLWDTIKEKKVRTMIGHTARVGTIAWSGPTLASGSRDRLIFLRDVRDKSAYTNRLNAHRQEVCGLKWSYDEPAFLASGGNDNQLHVVDSRNPTQPIHRFTDHTAAVKAIAWSPHQHGLLASGGGTADRCIRFWNTLSGSALHCVDTGSQVCNLAWSQNCNEIVSTHGYSLNQIVVWRYPSLSKVVTLTGHTYRVLYLAMSPDGSTIVTGAGDETLRFWQVFPGPRSDAKNNAGGLLFPNTLGSVIR